MVNSGSMNVRLNYSDEEETKNRGRTLVQTSYTDHRSVQTSIFNINKSYTVNGSAVLIMLQV